MEGTKGPRSGLLRLSQNRSSCPDECHLLYQHGSCSRILCPTLWRRKVSRSDISYYSQIRFTLLSLVWCMFSMACSMACSGSLKLYQVMTRTQPLSPSAHFLRWSNFTQGDWECFALRTKETARPVPLHQPILVQRFSEPCWTDKAFVLYFSSTISEKFYLKWKVFIDQRQLLPIPTQPTLVNIRRTF